MGEPEGSWSQVKRKGRRLRHVAKPADEGASKLESDILRPNPNPEYSVGDIFQHHEKLRQRFDESSCWGDVEKQIDSLVSEKTLPTIKKAVCLGTGPYDPADGSSQAKRTAHIQTAAFCAVVDHLRRSSSIQHTSVSR